MGDVNAFIFTLSGAAERTCLGSREWSRRRTLTMRRSPSRIPTNVTKQPNSQVGTVWTEGISQVESEMLWMCMLQTGQERTGVGANGSKGRNWAGKLVIPLYSHMKMWLSYMEPFLPASGTVSKAWGCRLWCMIAARARALQGPSRVLWFLLLAEVFASASSQQLPMPRCAPTCASVLQLKSASRKIGSVFTFWRIQVAV